MEGCGQFVVIHGKNGMGKSNILEAVYVASALKSFREHIPSHFIKWGESSAIIDVHIRTQYGSRKLNWSYSPKRRLLNKNMSEGGLHERGHFCDGYTLFFIRTSNFEPQAEMFLIFWPIF